MNALRDPIEALCNFQIQFGDSWGFQLTEGNAVLIVPRFLLSQSAVSGASMFHLKSVQDDWVTCRTWDGTTEGATDVLVAKEWNNRTSLSSQTVGGLLHNYSYGPGPSETWAAGVSTSYNIIRLSSDGSISEEEQITPLWIENEVIFAIGADTGLVNGSGIPVAWLMIRSCQWEAL